VSVVLCGLAWALALKLPFERLISIDLILYGSSLLLEFVALVVLRIREPNLERPFKAGNLAVACLLGAGPAVLIGYCALCLARREDRRRHIGFAVCSRGGNAGAGALLGHGCSTGPSAPGRGARGRPLKPDATSQAAQIRAPASSLPHSNLTHAPDFYLVSASFALLSWNCLAQWITWSRA